MANGVSVDSENVPSELRRSRSEGLTDLGIGNS